MQGKLYFCVLLLGLFEKESYGLPSRHLNVRIVRDAEAMGSSTESVSMLSSTSPISVTIQSSSMSPSGHEMHSVDCQSIDHMELEKSCPDENSCPKDEESLEKCCHCINKCCNGASMNEMGNSKPGMSSGNNSSKDAGSKIKDAVSSAEGWIKNAGQNIKSSWDKAKDSIKQTAGDVKDKVKKGINSVAGKVKNATEGSESGNCTEKDGKCNTDMSMDNNSSSTEASSEETPKMTTTKTPGNKKMKREVYRRTYYPSTMYGSRDRYHGNTGFSGLGHFDNGDSNEYAFRKTTTTTGARDINRHYKRSTPDFMTKNVTIPESSPSPSGQRSKRSSVHFPTEPSSEGNSTTTMSTSSSTTTIQNSDAGKSQSRHKRSQSSAGGRNSSTTSESSTFASASRDTSETPSGKREKRSPIMAQTADSPPCTATAMNNENAETSRRSKRETRQDEESSTSIGGSTEQATSSTGPPDGYTPRNDSTSCANCTPAPVSTNEASRPAGKGSIKFPPPAPVAYPRPSLGMVYPSSFEELESQLDQPPVIVYPDGRDGVICRDDRRKRNAGNIGESYYPDYIPSEEYPPYYPSMDKSTGTGDLSMSTTSNWGGYGPSSMGGGGWGQSGSLGGGTLTEPNYEGSSHTHQHNYHSHKTHHQNGEMNDEMNSGGTLDSVNLGDDTSQHYPHDDSHFNHHNHRNSSDKSYHHQNHNNKHHSHHQNKHHGGDENSHSNPNHDSNGSDGTYAHGVVSSADAEEKGSCRPLASRAKCASLRADSVECLYDSDCSGSKKCCFYHCDPMKIIGVCEHITYTVTKS